MPSNPPTTPVRCAEPTCGHLLTEHNSLVGSRCQSDNAGMGDCLCSRFVPPSPSAAEPSRIPPTFEEAAVKAFAEYAARGPEVHPEQCAYPVGMQSLGKAYLDLLLRAQSPAPVAGTGESVAWLGEGSCVLGGKSVTLDDGTAQSWKKHSATVIPLYRAPRGTGTGVAETQGLPIANGLILVEPSGVLRPEYAWHPAQQGDALAHVSHLNVGRPVGQRFTIEPFFTLSNLQAHRSPRVAEGTPAVREPSEATTLLTEALDLVPRISDDDAMTPALRDWCRKVHSTLNAGATQ